MPKTADMDALAPFMRDLPRGLQEQQARIGIVQIQASAGELTHQSMMIESWIRPEERQAKPVLPLDGAMAGAGVAAQLAEDGHDMPAELRFRRQRRRVFSQRDAWGGKQRDTTN